MMRRQEFEEQLKKDAPFCLCKDKSEESQLLIQEG
jgi:hypothetical protein